MYFFRRAEGSTVEEVLERLPDPVFKRAVGVLEMISRTPDQRRHYDARLKWELDENTRIQTAFEEGEIKGREEGREEGREKGREEGELFGKIRMLQNLLSLPQSTDQELQSKSRTELDRLATELQAQLRKRMT
jgi:predicted transposase YdaD